MMFQKEDPNEKQKPIIEHDKQEKGYLPSHGRGVDDSVQNLFSAFQESETA